MTPSLFVGAVLVLFTVFNVISIYRHQRDRRRDDLTALADAVLPTCGAILRSYMPDHLWHDCGRDPAHTSALTHQCRCGTEWKYSLDDQEQIRMLDRMLDEPAYDRRQS